MYATTKTNAVRGDGSLLFLTPSYRVYLDTKRKMMRRVPLDHEGFSEDKLVFFAEEPYTQLRIHKNRVEVQSSKGKFTGVVVRA